MKLTVIFTSFLSGLTVVAGCTEGAQSDKKAVISHGKVRSPNIDDHVCAVDAAKAVLKFQVDKLTKDGFKHSMQIFESLVDKSDTPASGYEGTVSFKVLLSYETDLRFLVRIKQDEVCRVVSIEEIK